MNKNHSDFVLKMATWYEIASHFIVRSLVRHVCRYTVSRVKRPWRPIKKNLNDQVKASKTYFTRVVFRESKRETFVLFLTSSWVWVNEIKIAVSGKGFDRIWTITSNSIHTLFPQRTWIWKTIVLRLFLAGYASQEIETRKLPRII